MDDLTCVPSRTNTCHWELTKFVSAPALRDQFVEHGKKITQSLLSAVDVLGQHALVHHDIWEDNVVVRARLNEETDTVEYSALLLILGCQSIAIMFLSKLKLQLVRLRRHRHFETKHPNHCRDLGEVV